MIEEPFVGNIDCLGPGLCCPRRCKSCRRRFEKALDAFEGLQMNEVGDLMISHYDERLKPLGGPKLLVLDERSAGLSPKLVGEVARASSLFGPPRPDHSAKRT